MSTLPSGTVTFLFTDIEGSTKLAQEHPDKWESLRGRHHAILQSAMDADSGYVFQIIGDAFCVAFHTAKDALNAAIHAQRNLQSEDWGDTPIKVRMGIHTGEAELQAKGDYHGYLAMSRVQRLMSAGHGGQILISQNTEEFVRNKIPEGVTLRDMGERRLKDLIRPEHIYQLIIPNLPTDFPPLKTLDEYRHNLPVQMTSFIGRKKEVLDVAQAIEKHRLVTLTGAGGSGKTRLSLQVAGNLLDHFQNGIWFIELAPIHDSNLVVKTIAKTLGLSDVAGRTIEDVLKDYLSGKELLLVLDNFEQVINAASIIKELLSVAPKIKILITSRILLRITGEQEYVLPLLALPDQKQPPALEQLSKLESICLFVERAQAVRSSFSITDKNAFAVAEICRHLDGLPLAIELAAAYVRLLSPHAILAQLDDRLNFLKSKARDLTPRQQTLRGAIDWSYNLLTENEQALFRRLSVFTGDTNLSAIENVCDFSEHNALELVEALVTNSLLKTNEVNDEIRFSMLELIKDYAKEKLEATNETKTFRDQHLYYYKNRIEKIEPELLGPDQVVWLDQLDHELGDIRSAIQWAKDNQQTEYLLNFTGSLCLFWQRRGHLNEGVKFLEEALAAPGSENFPNGLAKVLNSLGILFFTKGDYISATSKFEQGILTARQHNNINELACGLTWQATAFMRLQKFSEAHTSVNEGLELYARLGNKWGQGLAHFMKGRIELESGTSTSALTHFQQSTLDFRQSGDLWGQALSLNSLGSLYLQTGQLELAQAECKKSLALREQMKDQWGINSCYLNLGDIARLQNSTSQEIDYYRKSYELGLELGLKGDQARAANCLGFAALHTQDVQEAIANFSKSLKIYSQTNHIRGICECLAGYAGVAVLQENIEDAVALLGATSAILRSNDIKMWRVDQTDFDTNLAIAHKKLDKAKFTNIWEYGYAMTMEQAMERTMELALEKINE